MLIFYLTNMVTGGSPSNSVATQVYSQPSLSIGLGIRLCLTIGAIVMFQLLGRVFYYPLNKGNNYVTSGTISWGEKP